MTKLDEKYLEEINNSQILNIKGQQIWSRDTFSKIIIETTNGEFEITANVFDGLTINKSMTVEAEQ